MVYPIKVGKQFLESCDNLMVFLNQKRGEEITRFLTAYLTGFCDDAKKSCQVWNKQHVLGFINFDYFLGEEIT